MPTTCILAPVAALLLTVSIGVSQQPPPQEQEKKPSQPAQESKEVKKPPRKRVVTDLSGFDLLEPSKSRKQTTVVGATRGLPRPVTLAPRLGKLYGPHPVFAWSYEGKTSQFTFVLLNDAQVEVYRAEVASTSFRYPPEAPVFEPGKTYFWVVEVSSAVFGSNSSTPVGLLTVSSSQRGEIEAALARISPDDPYQVGLARARLFTEHRLWYDAIAAYTELIAHFPDRAELYEERGTIYAQLEATQALADQDFARAEQLEMGGGSVN